MTEKVNGWEPPLVYDIANDRHRVATQADIDRMQHENMTLRRVVGALERAIEDARINLVDSGLCR